MSDDIEFVDGLIVKPPHAKAPDFVKAQLSIKVKDLTAWLLNKSDEDWINLDVKAAKSGKWYAAVSKFKPKAKEETPPAKKPIGKFDDMEDDIPF